MNNTWLFSRGEFGCAAHRKISATIRITFGTTTTEEGILLSALMPSAIGLVDRSCRVTLVSAMAGLGLRNSSWRRVGAATALQGFLCEPLRTFTSGSLGDLCLALLAPER